MLARILGASSGRFNTFFLCQDNLTENRWTIHWTGRPIVFIIVVIVVKIEVTAFFPIAIRTTKFIIFVVVVFIVVIVV